ncbi:MAG: Fur family transcriptional regulator [Candidatus Dormibacteria bacterium]
MPRPSPVTDAVRTIVQAEDRHLWSLDDLHARVRVTVGSANFSSILRAVSALEQAGVLDRIELGDGKARYEVHQQHHEHIRCGMCGRVAEVPGCVLEDATAAVRESTGFLVRGHQLVFSGTCPDCAVDPG